MMLIAHLLLGFREPRDARYYHDDEMVKRLPGLKHLPEVCTVSRALASADEHSVQNPRAENRHLVLARLGELRVCESITTPAATAPGRALRRCRDPQNRLRSPATHAILCDLMGTMLNGLFLTRRIDRYDGSLPFIFCGTIDFS